MENDNFGDKLTTTPAITSPTNKNPLEQKWERPQAADL